jgi:glutamate/aspartate transport system substrate-binding protein
MLLAGKVDAFATDDVLRPSRRESSVARYHVVGDYLSCDPYGLMFRRNDPDFAAIVEGTFRRLAESREIVQLYNRRFQTRLPGGETLDLPMSPELEEIFRVEGVPD